MTPTLPAHAVRRSPRSAAERGGAAVAGVVNVIELVADAEGGWVEAVQNAVREAGRTVRHITGVEVTNLTAMVEDGRIKSYRANVNLAFVVEGRRGEEPRESDAGL